MKTYSIDDLIQMETDIPVTLIKPSHGWIGINFKEFWKYRELLFFLTWRDIKVRYKQTLLGASWAVLQPFMTMVVFSIFIFEIVSGFAMLSLSSASILPTIIGGWLLAIMDLQTIRLWHHMFMYVIVAFVFVHIYIAWWLDTVEKNGLIGSIFDGHKFVTGKELE